MNQTITQNFLQRYQSLSKADTPAFIATAQREAYELLSHTPLPHTGSEDYQKIDIDAILSHPWHIGAPEDPTEGVSRYTCSVLTENAIRCLISASEVKVLDEIPEGAFIGTLSSFQQSHPALVERYFNQMPSVREDALSALNTLFLQKALVVYLPAGMELDRPIHILHQTATDPRKEEMTFPRLLWIGEERSKSTILVCDHAMSDARSLRNSVIELYAGKHSHHTLYDLEESSAGTNRLHQVHIQQEAGSKVLIDNMTIQNGTTRNNFFCDLIGEGAVLDLDGLCILDGEQLADNWCHVSHSVPNCTSDQLFKYTVNDNARGNFTGMIYVAKDAQKTLAYQTNRNLLLSPKAKMYSKPQLEIYADDVKCSHGMTTGELSNLELFYLQQRGIPKVEAQLMLTIAFMSDVLDKIQLPSLRKRLTEIVEHRYRGIPALCKD